MPNPRFALHGLAPPSFTVCALFLPLLHGLCSLFFRPLLTPPSTAPFFASLSRFALHGFRALDSGPSENPSQKGILSHDLLGVHPISAYFPSVQRLAHQAAPDSAYLKVPSRTPGGWRKPLPLTLDEVANEKAGWTRSRIAFTQRGLAWQTPTRKRLLTLAGLKRRPGEPDFSQILRGRIRK